MAARGPRACTPRDLPPSGLPSKRALPSPYRHGTPRGNIGSWQADIRRTPPIERTATTTVGRRQFTLMPKPPNVEQLLGQRVLLSRDREQRLSIQISPEI